MKTYGFLIAVEHDRPVSKEFIEQALTHYMDEDNQYKTWGTAKVDVEALGEIKCYEGQEDEVKN